MKQEKFKPESGELEKAIFAGGCFWCMEHPFDTLPGVAKAVVGYTGGARQNPTYEDVCSGTTGHAEAIEITFDPSKIAYEKLLDVFWRQIDPTVKNRQFADAGSQYRTAIFYHGDEQKRTALASKEALEKSARFGNKPIVTEISPASAFWPAEEYHQAYYQKEPFRYGIYRAACGRDAYIKEIWEK